MKKTDVILMMADGLEECEALNTLDVLRRAGVDVATVSINGKKHVVGSHDIGIDCDMDLAELLADKSTAEVAADLQMLILPGGMPGTNNLGDCAPLVGLIGEMNKQGKWLAAICAAPMVFAHTGVLTGHEAICYPGCEGVLEENGATIKTEAVVVDENFVTSRGLGTAISFGLTLVRVLMGELKAHEVRDSIVSKDEIF